jgi:hypothetical protein
LIPLTIRRRNIIAHAAPLRDHEARIFLTEIAFERPIAPVTFVLPKAM